MVDCAASIRAAGGSSSDLLTPRGLTAIYTGATDKYIKRLVRVNVSQRARIYIVFLLLLFQNNVHVEAFRTRLKIQRNFSAWRVVDVYFAEFIP